MIYDVVWMLRIVASLAFWMGCIICMSRKKGISYYMNVGAAYLSASCLPHHLDHYTDTAWMPAQTRTRTLHCTLLLNYLACTLPTGIYTLTHAHNAHTSRHFPYSRISLYILPAVSVPYTRIGVRAFSYIQPCTYVPLLLLR